MIEVLVTIVIIAFGLLGMAGLQSRLQVSEMEAYQRAQALVLLNDMASRIGTNRSAARANTYVTTAIGAGSTCSSLSLDDHELWCDALQGAAVTDGANRMGAVIGGRGCVEALGNNEFMITVAWQGLIPISAPPASVGCGANSYDIGGTTNCNNDLCRRAVTTVVRIANLI